MSRNNRLLKKRQKFVKAFVNFHSEYQKTTEIIKHLSENVLFISESTLWQDLKKTVSKS